MPPPSGNQAGTEPALPGLAGTEPVPSRHRRDSTSLHRRNRAGTEPALAGTEQEPSRAEQAPSLYCLHLQSRAGTEPGRHRAGTAGTGGTCRNRVGRVGTKQAPSRLRAEPSREPARTPSLSPSGTKPGTACTEPCLIAVKSSSKLEWVSEQLSCLVQLLELRLQGLEMVQELHRQLYQNQQMSQFLHQFQRQLH